MRERKDERGATWVRKKREMQLHQEWKINPKQKETKTEEQSTTGTQEEVCR